MTETKSINNSLSSFPNYKTLENLAFTILLIFILNPVIRCIFHLITETDTMFMWRGYNRYALAFGAIIFVLYIIRLKLDNKLKGLIAENKKNPVIIFFGIFCLLMIISTLINGADTLTLFGEPYRAEGLLGYLSYIVYFLLAAFCMGEKKKHLWLNLFAVTSAAIAVFQIIDEVFLGAEFNLSVKGFIFSQFNHYGYYVMMSLMSFVMLFITEKNAKKRIIYALGIPLMTSALIFNNTFGCQLALIVGFIFICIILKLTDKKALKALLAVALVLLTFVTAYFTNDTARKRINSNFSQVASDIDETDENVTTTGLRLILWENGIKFISEKPIFGHGADKTAERMNEASDYDNSRCHNEYLHYAICFGIPASAVYCAAVFCVYLRGLKNKKHLTSAELIGLCGAFTYLASAFVGNTMYYTAPFLFIFLGLGYHKTESEKLL